MIREGDNIEHSSPNITNGNVTESHYQKLIITLLYQHIILRSFFFLSSLTLLSTLHSWNEIIWFSFNFLLAETRSNIFWWWLNLNESDEFKNMNQKAIPFCCRKQHSSVCHGQIKIYHIILLCTAFNNSWMHFICSRKKIILHQLPGRCLYCGQL